MFSFLAELRKRNFIRKIEKNEQYRKYYGVLAHLIVLGLNGQVEFPLFVEIPSTNEKFRVCLFINNEPHCPHQLKVKVGSFRFKPVGIIHVWVVVL